MLPRARPGGRLVWAPRPRRRPATSTRIFGESFGNASGGRSISFMTVPHMGSALPRCLDGRLALGRCRVLCFFDKIPRSAEAKLRKLRVSGRQESTFARHRGTASTRRTRIAQGARRSFAGACTEWLRTTMGGRNEAVASLGIGYAVLCSPGGTLPAAAEAARAAVRTRASAGASAHPYAPPDGYRHSSLNWSGYDVTGGPFTTVRPPDTAARPLQGSAFSDSAFWVGLDGDGPARSSRSAPRATARVRSVMTPGTRCIPRPDNHRHGHPSRRRADRHGYVVEPGDLHPQPRRPTRAERRSAGRNS